MGPMQVSSMRQVGRTDLSSPRVAQRQRGMQSTPKTATCSEGTGDGLTSLLYFVLRVHSGRHEV